MTTRQQGIAAIKAHEGLRLQAYPDPASGGEPWTIGWGHTGGVKRGDIITIEQAEQFLAEDIDTAQRGIRNLVKVPLTEGQLWALTSFVFNLGVGALRKSTLLKRLNAGDYAGAAGQFGLWVNAAGRPMPGLVRRRAEEKAMFLSAGPVNTSPAPTPKPEHVKETTMAIPAVALALLPKLLDLIPSLGRMFSSGSEVSERNLKVAAAAVDVVKTAVAARNEQEAVEIIAADPEALAKATEAVDTWVEMIEAGGGGITGARRADVAFVASAEQWWAPFKSPSFLIGLMLVPLVYMIVANVVGILGIPLSDEVRSAIANGVVGLVLGGLIGYYFGQTTSRNRTPAPPQ